MDTHFSGKIIGMLAVVAVTAALMAAVFAGCASGTSGVTGTSGTAGTTGSQGKDLQTNIFQDTTVTDAKSLIASTPGIVILDARTPEEFAAGHLANAINVDYKASSFKDELGKLDKSKTYLVYCRTGVRSLASVKIMTEVGFTHVNNLIGGITQWQADGGTVVN